MKARHLVMQGFFASPAEPRWPTPFGEIYLIEPYYGEADIYYMVFFYDEDCSAASHVPKKSVPVKRRGHVFQAAKQVLLFVEEEKVVI